MVRPSSTDAQPRRRRAARAPRARRRRAGRLAVAQGLALFVAATATTAPAPAQAARERIQIRVTRQEYGRPIPAGFLGLSIEFGSLYAYAGRDPRALNPVFARLIENLVPGGRPVLRIGGDSTDRTWWPVPGLAKPPWAAYTLSPTWSAVARRLALSTRARLILGINLLANSRALASAEARAFLRGIGRQRIAAFEIGNEPELYPTQPWYRTSTGQPVTGRAAGYGIHSYAREVARIRAALPRIALAAPATGALSWLSRLAALQAAEPGLRQITLHRYPLSRCVTNPSSPRYPTVAHLLSPGASEGVVRGVARIASLAHRRGLRFRVDELNAVTCGGLAGVSNTFASALWTLDTQFWMAKTGVDAVDVHIHPEAPANQLFTFRRRGGRWLGSVRPQYYGLLMFAQAAPAGARLLRIAGAPSGRLRTWATLGRDGRIRVLLINDSLTSASTVLVRAPAPATPATLDCLEAPSAYATRGVTLGGQSLGSAGTLGGPTQPRLVRPTRGGYGVRLRAASAAMLTIPW